MPTTEEAERRSVLFDRLADMIEARCGLSRQAQRNRLADYLAGCPQEERMRLADRLAVASDSDPAWQRLVESLLVHETFFYRHLDQLDVLARMVLPLLNRGRSSEGPPLRLWCAGCSTGEEAYTLAFLLRDAGCRATVTGTDLSTQAVVEARIGSYRLRPGLNSFRAMPDRGWRHFAARPGARDCWEVIPEVRRMVDFAVHNLMTPLPRDFAADIICCRNTLIYFGEAGARRAEATLVDAARPGTVLLLGPAERLRHSNVFRAMTDEHPQILHWPDPEPR